LYRIIAQNLPFWYIKIRVPFMQYAAYSFFAERLKMKIKLRKKPLKVSIYIEKSLWVL